ncbi:Rrf2 family transcriptional regulator [Roseateles saccharophilus]|uniref:BadM/Rrf2 family transcriptional regulator n=1 Tax=Roseateles saccharophilus TaxID=304 RepID=A0A4R3V1K9_ROSSA|nr:Rrf2 family transcriptional regulator [Roseateles saccharophilus]MDG0832343.1 Rrf2 family transcriptional regulator [Roseateles saccharophilus]TCU97037.1 BadM/Rrf2 family transcriptional regulator [Roseateles saccharophilus]
MRLTAFTDYSLRVLIYLAAEPERRATVGEICAAFDIKVNHLTKVVHHLARCGWLTTVRGKGGGLTLAKPAERICVGQVVRDTEGQALPAECFSAEDSHCAILSQCRLKGVLAEAVQAFYAVLDRYTLADITANRQELVQVLRFMAPTLAPTQAAS